jgi:hypothetical protein
MMTRKSQSLRGCINAHCKACIYDPPTAGTCRAPVTLCAVTSCDVFAVRKTTGSILESVYRFYGVEPSPDSDLTLIKASKDRFSEETGSVDSSTRGAA